MKRLFFALAAFTALAVAGTANAQYPPPGSVPGPIPPMAGNGGGYVGGYSGGGHMMHGGYIGGKFIGGGFLSGLFTNHPHKEKDHGNGGPFSRMMGRDRNTQTLPVAQGGGTLVYPQNPFIRSPRDFFMWDEK